MPRADRIDEKGIELLKEKQIAIFSTILPDGSPHATPCWVDVEPDGAHILINTAEGHIKLRNVERDPRVAVTVIDSGNPWRTVVVRGVVVDKRGPDQGSVEHVNMLSKKYTGRDPYVLADGETRVILRIKPTHVLRYSPQGVGWRDRQGDTGPRS